MRDTSTDACLFTRIGHKILVLVGLAVSIGFLGLLTFYAKHQERSILAEEERTVLRLTHSVATALQSVMLSGNVAIAQDFANGLREMPGVVDFKIYRSDGSTAFSDNATIDAVNAYLGGEAFPRRVPDDKPVSDVLPEGLRVQLELAVRNGREVSHYSNVPGGSRHLTYFAPIVSRDSCRTCHGRDDVVRGVLALTTSLAGMEADIAATRRDAVLLFVSGLLVILFLTWLLIDHAVNKPLGRVTTVMKEVAEEDNFALHQPVRAPGCDELSEMARSFNRMMERLGQLYFGLQNERDKLTTVLLSSREGVVVTDRSGSVVLVNPAAERLLGKTSERIIREGFFRIIDDEAYLVACLDAPSREKVPDHIVYNNRIMTIYASTSRTTDGQLVGQAALFRDITEEKKLEEQLRQLSNTDGLTSIANRRYMEETLRAEHDRAHRYRLSLGFMLIDVDHFKRFNDEHGHDTGDRVLQALAQVMKRAFRSIDTVCRYGGEEFCAILPNTDHEGAREAAERLRKRMENHAVDGLRVTISIGVAVFPTIDQDDDPQRLIKSADNALYAAKRAGRNRVVMASDKAVQDGAEGGNI